LVDEVDSAFPGLQRRIVSSSLLKSFRHKSLRRFWNTESVCFFSPPDTAASTACNASFARAVEIP
jgi:hypothetical protein